MKCALCQINNLENKAYIITRKKLTWKIAIWKSEVIDFGESKTIKFDGWKIKKLKANRSVCQDCYEVYLKKQNDLDYNIIYPIFHYHNLKKIKKNDKIEIVDPIKLHQLIVN